MNTKNNTQQINMKQLEMHTKYLAILWNNDVWSKYHYLLLRDNCTCVSCVHPITMHKIRRYCMLDLNMRPKSVKCVDVVWNNTSEVHKVVVIDWNEDQSHKSHYELKWLWEYSFFTSTKAQQKQLQYKDTLIWEENESILELKFIDFFTEEGGQVTLGRALKAIAEQGILLIKDVPLDPKMLDSLGEKFGGIRETVYGRTWELKTTRPIKSIALNTNLTQELQFLDEPASLELIQCIENSCTKYENPGEFIFADSYLAAEKFQESYPDMFDVLTKVPVTFKYVVDGKVFQSRKRIICVDGDNDFVRLNYAPAFHSEIGLDNETAPLFYEALSNLDAILHNDSLTRTVPMREGDMVIFDNLRILHGRKGFTTKKGSFQFFGAFIGKDDFHAAYRSHFKADIL